MKLLDRDPAVRQVALGTWQGFLAFGFGSGLSSFAPGTVGTAVAVPAGLLLKSLPWPGFWIALILSFPVGVYLCGVSARRLGAHDPGGIVWDEMAAYWLTVAFLPLQWSWWLAAFLLFRLFDILKPWPIPWVERRFGGGLGIMLDDVVAAGYAIAVLAVAKHLV